MSYKTNPIANRLSINKGFCNTHFLNNKTAYNHNLIVWLSLYLFLKSYLAFKKIRLLSCEIRIVSQTHKILFISILKNPQQKKRRKYKNTYLSPINKTINKKALYLFYANMYNLKQMCIIEKKKSFKNLHIYYKIINKLFIRSKRRKIFNILKTKKINANKGYKIIYKNKLTINSFNVLVLKKRKIKIKYIRNQINEFKKIAKIFRQDKNFKNILFNSWARIRIKKIKSNLNKVLKNPFIFSSNRWKLNQPYFICRKKGLKEDFFRKTFSLKHLRNKTERFPEINKLYFLTKLNYEKWKIFLHRPRIYMHYFIFYKKLNKALYLNSKLSAYKNRGFLAKNIKNKIHKYLKLVKSICRPYIKRKQVKNKLWTNWYFYLLNRRKKKKKILQKRLRRIYLKKKKTNRHLMNRKFSKLKHRNTILLEKKSNFLWKWKKKLVIIFLKRNKYKKKRFIINKKPKKEKAIILLKKNNYKEKPFIINKKVKKKKAIIFLTKDSYKKRTLTINKKTKRKRRSYLKKKSKFFVTNKEYIRNTIKEEFFKRKTEQNTIQLQFLLEKLLSEHFQINFTIKVTNLFTLFNNKKIYFETFQTKKYKLNKTKTSLIISSAKYHKKLSCLKINKLNILKTNNITNKKYTETIEKTKENFFFGNKDKILGKSFYTLVNYHKYLNAQLLADEICRVMRKRKHHTSIFRTVKTLVDAFPENPIISYHITVEGKINSKSRATNLTVSQGHIPAQHFSARVNFGLSQAKTPTGTFGIRVYIFF